MHDAGTQRYPFDINPNTLTADFEVWICGYQDRYYLVPSQLVQAIYNDPDSYVPRRRRDTRVVTINWWTHTVQYAKGGQSRDLSPYYQGLLP